MREFDETIPRRLEWIAIILFVVNFFLMLYSLNLYIGQEAWALTVTAISTTTAVILLLSVIFSILGRIGLSKTILVAGLVGMMIQVVSFGAKLLQEISEWHDRYPF